MQQIRYFEKMPLRHLFLYPNTSLLFRKLLRFAGFGFFAVSLLSCSRNAVVPPRIDHDIVPSPGMYYGVSGRRVVRHAMLFDAECFFVDEKTRQIVFLSDAGGSLKQLPDVPLAFFAITLTNRTLRPLKVESLTSSWGEGTSESLSTESLNDALRLYGRSPDAGTLYTSRRITVDEFLIDHIPEQSVRYNFDFIAPGDRVLIFRAFPFPPVRAKTMKITLGVMDEGEKKTVDFDFIQKESRHYLW